jgi:hypothetical protein
MDELASWEMKNWVQVDYEREGEKAYVTKVTIHRERKSF